MEWETPVRGGSVPLVGVVATVSVVQPFAGRVDVVCRHGLVIVGGRTVLALATDQIAGVQLREWVPIDGYALCM